MQCKKCGNLVEFGINVCPNCGNIMPEQNYKFNFSNSVVEKQEQKKLIPRILIVYPNGYTDSVKLGTNKMYMGRYMENPQCPILIKSSLISAIHGRFEIVGNDHYYIDEKNTNGTYLNNNMIVKTDNSVSKPMKLKDGDILSVGDFSNKERISIIFSLTTNDDFVWECVDLRQKNTVTIGRERKSDICIQNVKVSRNHAIINKAENLSRIIDNHSSNGTFVNGILIREKALQNQNIINIGATKIFYINDFVIYRKPQLKTNNFTNTSRNIKKTENLGDVAHSTMGFDVEVKDISRIVPCKKGTGINGGSKKYILQHISLSINAGELVAICGGSGAGKTTFMNCINGFEPATSGQVLVNEIDLYKNYSSLKNSIGYVPQQDIIHDDLTLESLLTYTAKLRLQKDITKSEIKKRVSEVLKMVDLEQQRHTYVKKLSGGQRKRGSIAVELISDPSLFFLDEPTSGLDPEAETHLMHQLRNLAKDKGKTVIVITHTLQNIMLFDKIVFLAPGGKLCFYGTPEMAKKFFGVENLANAYELISKDIDGYVEGYERYRSAF